MAMTVRQFVFTSYRLINASNPTVPLHGDDESLMLMILNTLLNSFAATGLKLTIAQTYDVPLSVGQKYVTIGPANYIPTPDIPVGRLANMDSAWLNLQGVDYPLIDENRDEFLSSFKYLPLQGLPRFAIVFPEAEIVKIQIYPAPSEYFQFFIRGKFQLTNLTINDNFGDLPDYYMMYFLFAVAKKTAFFKGRAAAWTKELEAELIELTDIIVSASEVNLTICGDRASLLNANWRVQAGI